MATIRELGSAHTAVKQKVEALPPIQGVGWVDESFDPKKPRQVAAVVVDSAQGAKVMPGVLALDGWYTMTGWDEVEARRGLPSRPAVQAKPEFPAHAPSTRPMADVVPPPRPAQAVTPPATSPVETRVSPPPTPVVAPAVQVAPTPTARVEDVKPAPVAESPVSPAAPPPSPGLATSAAGAPARTLEATTLQPPARPLDVGGAKPAGSLATSSVRPASPVSTSSVAPARGPIPPAAAAKPAGALSVSRSQAYQREMLGEDEPNGELNDEVGTSREVVVSTPAVSVATAPAPVAPNPVINSPAPAAPRPVPTTPPMASPLGTAPAASRPVAPTPVTASPISPPPAAPRPPTPAPVAPSSQPSPPDTKLIRQLVAERRLTEALPLLEQWVKAHPQDTTALKLRDMVKAQVAAAAPRTPPPPAPAEDDDDFPGKQPAAIPVVNVESLGRSRDLFNPAETLILSKLDGRVTMGRLMQGIPGWQPAALVGLVERAWLVGAIKFK